MNKIFVICILFLNSFSVFSGDAKFKLEKVYFDTYGNERSPQESILLQLNDGSVLNIGEENYKFDPKTKKWSQVEALNIPRSGLKGITLKDGRLLVMGGSKKTGNILNPTYEYVSELEIFDPIKNQWTLIKAPRDVFMDGTLIQSENKILIFGADSREFNCNKLAILDLDSMTWKEGSGPYLYCFGNSLQAYKLPSNNILLISETNGFDSRIYSSTGEMKELLVASPGGFDGLSVQSSKGLVSIANSELMKVVTYNEEKNKWVITSDLVHSRQGRNYKMSGSFTLADGRIGFYGYRKEISSFDGDLYNPQTGTWENFSFDLSAGNSWPVNLEVISLKNSNQIMILVTGSSVSQLITF